ncbi:hypothetical protein JXB12_04080 [candidate division KSB1 bacterium]|nr:hypothetical protein [candidate division KSB1 bacterium]
MKTVALIKDRNKFWTVYQQEIERNSFAVDLIDIWSKSEQDRLLSNHYDAFIWRAKHNPEIKNLARRFIYLFDQILRVPTYPNWHSYWHYDDKIAQYYLFQKYDVPTIPTHIFFQKDEAMEFTRHAEYPMIYKSAHGAGSSNVGLLKSKHQARRYINKIFGGGVRTYFKSEIQKGYVYLQDFLPDNEGDYRVVCDNRLAYGFFRRNRKNKPFASGSSLKEYIDIPEQVLDVAFDANRKMGFDIMSYDLLRNRDGRWVITEISAVFGDLNLIKYHYYLRQEDSWKMTPMHENVSQMAISHILKNVWKWI